MLFLTTIALAAGRATASSTLNDPEDKKVKHTAAKAVDGLFKSGWGEGEDGYGEGAWLELDFVAFEWSASGESGVGARSVRGKWKSCSIPWKKVAILSVVLIDGMPLALRSLDRCWMCSSHGPPPPSPWPNNNKERCES